MCSFYYYTWQTEVHLEVVDVEDGVEVRRAGTVGGDPPTEAVEPTVIEVVERQEIGAVDAAALATDLVLRP